MNFRNIFNYVVNKLTSAPTTVDEGVFDTNVFKKFSQKYSTSDIKLTNKDLDNIHKIMMIPDARPGDFDGTLEAWFLRISIWGRISITHKNPEKRVNRKITQNQFLDYVDDQELNATYGIWNIEEVYINRIRLYREFWSMQGKEVVEELVVDINLRPDIKKALKNKRTDKSIV